jgi:hypothetical protein
MKPYAICLALVLAFSSAQLMHGETFFEDLLLEYMYGYRVASSVDMRYEVNMTVSVRGRTHVFDDVTVNWTDLDRGDFVLPIATFPVVLAYNIPTLPADTDLVLSPDFLLRVLTDSTVTFADPELVELNPNLTVATPVRMILDSSTSPANQQIIDFLNMNVTMQSENGSWSGVATSNRHVRLPGYAAVMAALAVQSNTIAFVPGPLVAKADSANVRVALLYANGELLRPFDHPSFEFTERTHGANVEVSTAAWPLQRPASVSIPQTGDCSASLTNARFIHWCFADNDDLDDTTYRRGYHIFDRESRNRLAETLEEITCGGKKLLVFDNLSDGNRSNGVLAISIIFTVLLLAVSAFSFWSLSDVDKGKIQLIITHLSLIVGLVLSFASYVLYWLPPSTDGICISREWLLTFGYTLVVTPVCGLVIILERVFGTQKIKQINMAAVNKTLAVLYGVILSGQLIILLLRTTAAGLRSEEIVVDAIGWKSEYSCVEDGGALEIVQISFFILIGVTMVGIIYRNFYTFSFTVSGQREKTKEKLMMETVRYILGAANNHILVFALLLIVISIIDLSDGNKYVMYVVIVLFAQVNAVSALIIPKLTDRVKTFRKNFSSASGRSGRMNRSDSFATPSTPRRTDSQSTVKETDTKDEEDSSGSGAELPMSDKEMEEVRVSRAASIINMQAGGGAANAV